MLCRLALNWLSSASACQVGGITDLDYWAQLAHVFRSHSESRIFRVWLNSVSL